MPDFGIDDPLSTAVRGRAGGVYALDTATQQNPLDHGFGNLLNSAISARQQFEQRRQNLFSQLQYANNRQARGITAELKNMDMQDRMSYLQNRDASRNAYLEGRDADRMALANQRRDDSVERDIYRRNRDAERFGYQVEHDDQKEADFAANQRRLMAHDNAIEADKAIRRERDTRIDKEGADAMMQMHQLDTAYRNGDIDKEQYDDGMLGLGQTHFEALHRHPEAAKHWASYLDQDDKMSQYQTRLNLREAAKLKSKYGVDIQTDPNSGEIDFDSMHKAVLATPKGQGEALNALNNAMLKQHGVPISAVFQNAAGGRLEKDGDPTSFKQTDPNDKANPQTHVRMAVLSPTGQQHNVITDKARFDAIKSQYEPIYNEILSHGQAAQQPTTVKMRSPDGSERDVPADHAAHFQSLGATLVPQ